MRHLSIKGQNNVAINQTHRTVATKYESNNASFHTVGCLLEPTGLPLLLKELKFNPFNTEGLGADETHPSRLTTSI